MKPDFVMKTTREEYLKNLLTKSTSCQKVLVGGATLGSKGVSISIAFPDRRAIVVDIDFPTGLTIEQVYSRVRSLGMTPEKCEDLFQQGQRLSEQS